MRNSSTGVNTSPNTWRVSVMDDAAVICSPHSSRMSTPAHGQHACTSTAVLLGGARRCWLYLSQPFNTVPELLIDIVWERAVRALAR